MHGEADLIGVLPDDLDGNGGGGGDALGRIGAVRKGGLDEGPEAAGDLQERAGPVAVLNVGRMGEEQQRPPIGIHQRVALAAFTFLPAS